MAVRFTGQRCQDCQGGLEYNKKEKYWECPYCGKKYERELRFDKVQIDGLAGINDLVRSTLSKLIALDFSGAERDLFECEKINHASIGTLIANISLPLFKSFFTRERQQELAKANNFLQKLNRDFSEIDEPEEILYDFIDSSDIYALLYVVYSMTNQDERQARIFDLLDCDEVYNANVIKFLLSALLKENQIESADVLVDKVQSSDCRVCLSTILTSYPSGEKKAEHVEKLLSKVKAETGLSKVFDTYFSSNNDDSNVQVEIFMSAISRQVGFNTTAVIQSVLSSCDSVESATRIFNAIGAKRLDEETASAIFNWCICDCNDGAISEIGFKTLFNSNSVFEMTDDDAIKLFQSEQSEQIKAQKILQMINTFKTSNRNMDKIVAYHLTENSGSYEYRKEIFEELLKRIISIPFSVIETYLLKVSYDGENKDDILNQAFAKSKTLSLGANIVSEYLKTDVDTPEAREQVIGVFLSLKIIPDSESVSYYLLNKNELHSDKVLDLMISQSWKPKADTFDKYINSLSDYSKYNSKVAQIATRFGYVLSANSFVKYLLNVKEPGSQKIALTEKHYQTCANSVKSADFYSRVNGDGITGNVAQIYMLDGQDDLFVMQEILKFFKKERIKLDLPIDVESERKKIKFKKFIELNSDSLSKKVETLSQELL